jgi:hypothetical protein
MSHENIDPKLLALESALASLAPAPGRLDRDQMLFRAGRATSRTRLVWPCTSVALAALVAGMGMLLALRPDAAPTVRIVYVPVMEQNPTSAEPMENLSSAADYARPTTDAASARLQPLSCYQLERLAQRWGLDALPDAAAAADGEDPAPARRLLDARVSVDSLDAQIP